MDERPGKDSVQVLSNCAKFRCAFDTDSTVQCALHICQLIKDIFLLHVAVQSMASRLQGFKLTPVAGNKDMPGEAGRSTVRLGEKDVTGRFRADQARTKHG